MTDHLFIDGAPATPGDLAHQALVNYGAYTSFRVEGVGVRGLDRHLTRLGDAARELFGAAVADDRLRSLIRQALGGRTDAWLRVSLFSREITHRQTTAVAAPAVMVGVFDPPAPLAGSVRLQLQSYEREAPHLKHAATFGLIRARRLARAEGYDDALFMARDGRISEGSLWNVGFLQGDTVVWPEAPMLAGVSQALIEKGLAAAGVVQERRLVTPDDLPAFDGAFLFNSATPAASIAAIGDHAFTTSPDWIARLTDAWRSNPCQAI